MLVSACCDVTHLRTERHSHAVQATAELRSLVAACKAQLAGAGEQGNRGAGEQASQHIQSLTTLAGLQVTHCLWNAAGFSSNSLRWLTICTRNLGSRTVLICSHRAEVATWQRYPCVTLVSCTLNL